MMKTDKLKLWEVKLLIIVNNKLYANKEIDENLYIKTRNKLLLILKNKTGQDVKIID